MSEGATEADGKSKLGASGSALAPTQKPPSPQEGFVYQPDPSDLLKGHEAETARNLAYRLVWILAASVVGQYGALGILAWRNRSDVIPNFEHLFNAWLPVIAGLASSAVTFYLTRQKR